MTRISACTLALATALTCAAGTAHADSEHGVRVGLKAAFGFTGKLKTTTQGVNGSVSDDLVPTLGFAVFGQLPIMRYFQVGLQTTMGWVNTDSGDNANIDDTMVLDVSAVLKGRVPLMNDKLELYAMLPVGVTFDFLPSQIQGVDDGVGWNVGLQFGASYMVTDALGVLFEIGWQGRAATSSTNANRDVTLTMHQFAMNFGAFYAF